MIQANAMNAMHANTINHFNELNESLNEIEMVELSHVVIVNISKHKNHPSVSTKHVMCTCVTSMPQHVMGKT